MKKAPGPIDSALNQAIQTHLSFIDEELPGMCVGYYLVGSIALNDFQPGQSDIDFVAVLSKEVDGAINKALERVSERLVTIPGLPDFDGIYVWPSLLRGYPSGDNVPYVFGRRFHRNGAFAANPITWLTLDRYPCSIREYSDIEIWSNEQDIKDWCLRNLDEYWSMWIKRIQFYPLGIIRSLYGKNIQWGVLGVVRLHATIVEGRLISKSEAAMYASQNFSNKYRDVIDSAIDNRTHKTDRKLGVFKRRSLMIDFMNEVMNSARLFAKKNENR